MPEGGEGELDEAPPPPPPPIGGKAMELDLDMEVSWSFDAAAFLSDSPPPEYFLASPSSTPAPSPSPQSSLQVPHSSSLQSAGVGLDDNATELSLPDLHNFVTGTSDEANDALPSVRSDAQPVSKLAEDETYDVSCIIKGKMAQALRRFKEATSQRVLIQVWAPVMSGGRQVLTTSEQPFMLDPHCISLLQYRTASLTYLFSVDGDSDGYLGLPGRVFCQQFPEWTPDVQYYSSKEYPRLTHALNYNVKGSLALPVFEPFHQKCVGVVELIMTSPKINYAVEVDRVCKALEVVNLKSTEILSFPSMRIFNEGHQAAMSEILEVLTTICEMHKLPLAQTWVPRGHGKGLPHSIKDQNTTDGREQSRLSTTDAAFYVVEPCMWGFRDACGEHHLQKGQGVAGMAYSLCKPCFSSDVTRFGKDSYPLVHYARMFGLAGCFALCLQSCRTRDDIYVVEFFLPGNCRGEAEQLTILEAILSSVRRSSRTLNFFLKKEIEGEALSEILRVDGDLESPKIPLVLGSSGSNDKESTRKSDHEKGSVTLIKEERRRGKAEKTISLEVLRNYFAGSLKEAAKSLGVCPTTMKRICRQHGISRWPSRKIKKVNRSLSKLKRVIESVQGPEGAFDLLPSLTGSWPEKRKSSGIEKANELPGIDLGTSCSPSQRDFPSQRDSQGSCPGENPQRPLERSPSVHEGLIEDSVSSKELNNPVLSFNTNDSLDAEVNTSSSTVKIKANYRGNIIRFSLEFGAGLFFLKEQVAQRLKLDLGAFDLRYLDDEGEWVLLACDVDLEECLEFSNGQVIRLSVVDFAGPHGSSSSQSS